MYAPALLRCGGCFFIRDAVPDPAQETFWKKFLGNLQKLLKRFQSRQEESRAKRDERSYSKIVLANIFADMIFEYDLPFSCRLNGISSCR